jgi:hypothetical protein
LIPDYRYDALVSSAIKAPEFLRETKYKSPVEPTDGIVQYAKQTKLNFFEYLHSNPSLTNDFNLFMGNTMGARQYWYEWYDVEGRLLTGFDPERCSTLLVDVGGGKGHDLVAFEGAFGKTEKYEKGNLALQDLPHILDQVPDTELTPAITKMPHDFFTEQLVKGESNLSRFYPIITTPLC